jgi:predicted GNAT family acetyltransferase
MNPADYDAWYATPRGRWIGETEYALAARLLRMGVRPFLYIVTTNAASIRLTESMGFARAGRFSWFGTL